MKKERKIKLIIAGSRTIHMKAQEIKWIIEHFNLNPTVIVCGVTNGIDMSGYKFAKKYDIVLESFPVEYEDWKLYGKRAGHIRNAKMARCGDVLLLIHDGKSKGSANMKENMKILNKPIYEVVINDKRTIERN